MKIYKYSLVWSIIKYVGVLMIIFLILIWFISVLQRVYPPFRILQETGCDSTFNECGGTTLGIMISLGIILWVINSFPTIIQKEDGIIVEFLVFHYFLKWSDLHQIRNHRFGLVNWWFVSTAKLPFFFRVYGLGAYTLKPTFVIFSRISNHKELILEIQKHLHNPKAK